MIRNIFDKRYCFPFANVVAAAPSAAQDGTYLILTGYGTTDAQHQQTIALLRTVDTNHDPTIVTAPYGVCFKVSGFCVEELLNTRAPSRKQLFEPPASVINVPHLDATGITSISREIDERTEIPIVLMHFSPETPRNDVVKFANKLAELGVASVRTRVDSINPDDTAYAVRIAATDYDALIKGGAQLTEAHIAAQVQSAQVDAKNLTRIAEHLVLLSLVTNININNVGSFKLDTQSPNQAKITFATEAVADLEKLFSHLKPSLFTLATTTQDGPLTSLSITGPNAHTLPHLVSERIRIILEVARNSDKTLFSSIDPKKPFTPQAQDTYMGATNTAKLASTFFFQKDSGRELVNKLKQFSRALGYPVEEEIHQKLLLVPVPSLVAHVITLARRALKIDPAPTHTDQPQPPGKRAHPDHALPQLGR